MRDRTNSVTAKMIVANTTTATVTMNKATMCWRTTL